MQFSKNWLKDFIDLDLSTEEICYQLTMAGIEVDNFENVKSAITGNDAIIKLDITPNRGDCFSILGVARELAILNNLKLKLPKIAKLKSTYQDTISVNACAEGPVYFGRTIKDFDMNAVTLPHIAERLTLSDQKLIDPVVDITNYIILELGQPLHAFDRDKLNGDISVRLAKKDESITLLDDQTLNLDASCLVISDEKEAVAFAGVMGGKDSSVTSSTSSIFLESAYFKPSVIRGKARKFGFQTEASLRFERGVDYTIQEFALNRATYLLNQTIGGEIGSVISDSLIKELPNHKKINIDIDRTNKILGTTISTNSAIKYFKGLGLSPEATKSGKISVSSPPWRYDINIEADLVEELARLEGYDSLPEESLLPIYKRENISKENHLRNSLVSFGFNEIVSYAFISQEDHNLYGQDQKTLNVSNPISQNMSVMRTNLVSGLINTFLYNLNHGQNNQRLFEIGNTFHIDKSNNVSEKKLVAGLMSGKKSSDNWKEKFDNLTFYDLKGLVQDLLSDFSQPNSYSLCNVDFLHPGMSSAISFEKKTIGFLGSIHPVVLNKVGVKDDLFIFSFELDKLIFESSKSFEEYSKFPSSTRDLAFVFDKEVNADEIKEVIQNSAGEFYKDLEIFDIYEGERIDAGKKSIALSISWQSSSKTLLDGDIDTAVEKIVNSIKKELDGTLRT
ncbi:MAG: phenylalanine--tRNA ligase subunit beta [Pseudomonadota bacterium]|nr:phenylalanine--tRNA ligase subunit beta [Pseudomonadota bacterium]MED5349466.1 phenylalanine--tRNA ligase subunit beta [Pseudomonadota bacterium]